MNFEVPPELMRELEQLAQAENRNIDSVLSDAVNEYLARKRETAEAFREEVRQTIEEHQWLMDELAKR